MAITSKYLNAEKIILPSFFHIYFVPLTHSYIQNMPLTILLFEKNTAIFFSIFFPVFYILKTKQSFFLNLIN